MGDLGEKSVLAHVSDYKSTSPTKDTEAYEVLVNAVASKKSKQETVIYIFEKTNFKNKGTAHLHSIREHSYKAAALAVALDNLLHDKKTNINVNIVRVQVNKNYHGIGCIDGKIIVAGSIPLPQSSAIDEFKEDESSIPLTDFKTFNESVNELLKLKSMGGFPDIPIPKRYEAKFSNCPEFYLGKLLEHCWNLDRLDVPQSLNLKNDLYAFKESSTSVEDGISNAVKRERRACIKSWTDILLDSGKSINDRIILFKKKVQVDLNDFLFRDREPCIKLFFLKSPNDTFWKKINAIIRQYQQQFILSSSIESPIRRELQFSN